MENEKKEQKTDDEKLKEITEAGDIGDEQMPAGEIKTDKKEWNYTSDKIIKNDLPRKIKDFVAGL